MRFFIHSHITKRKTESQSHESYKALENSAKLKYLRMATKK
jgi:hypothetical protein